MKKKGLSQVIATVLLISLAMALALFIATWGKGFLSTLTSPPDCSNVFFDAEIVDNNLFIVNKGKTKIEGFLIKSFNDGDTDASEIKFTVDLGRTESIELRNTPSSNRLLIVPLVLVETPDKTTLGTCPDQFGVEINL